MQPQPTLTTLRCVLRPLCACDAPVVQRLAGDARIAETAAHIPHPYPDGAAETWIDSTLQQYARGAGAAFGITLAGSGDLVGVVSLGIAPEQARAELGYWVGVPYWSRGYATEAAHAALDFAFRGLGLRRVFARHLGRNPASGRVMQKIGMTCEGTLRWHELVRGCAEDMVYYGILMEEWIAP